MYSFFFSSRRRHTRLQGDWSSDVCSSDLRPGVGCAPRCGSRAWWRVHPGSRTEDRKSVVKGKSVDLGGRRIIKKKKDEPLQHLVTGSSPEGRQVYQATVQPTQ